MKMILFLNSRISKPFPVFSYSILKRKKKKPEFENLVLNKRPILV